MIVGITRTPNRKPILAMLGFVPQPNLRVTLQESSLPDLTLQFPVISRDAIQLPE